MLVFNTAVHTYNVEIKGHLTSEQFQLKTYQQMRKHRHFHSDCEWSVWNTHPLARPQQQQRITSRFMGPLYSGPINIRTEQTDDDSRVSPELGCRSGQKKINIIYHFSVLEIYQSICHADDQAQHERYIAAAAAAVQLPVLSRWWRNVCWSAFELFSFPCVSLLNVCWINVVWLGARKP